MFYGGDSNDMKGKNIFRLVFLVLIILFIALYLTQLTGYYEFQESKKSSLTKDAIERFEKDVKEGREIVAKNYLVEEKNYQNKASSLGMKVSGLIEKGFNRAMNALFREVDKAIQK